MRLFLSALLCLCVSIPLSEIQGQTVTSTTAPKVIGTISAINGNILIINGDEGWSSLVRVAEGARFLLVPPNSTDLSLAQTIKLTDIAVGDRALVNGDNPGVNDRPLAINLA